MDFLDKVSDASINLTKEFSIKNLYQLEINHGKGIENNEFIAIIKRVLLFDLELISR